MRLRFVIPFMMGAFFALIVQQSLIIYLSFNDPELDKQVMMSTYIVTNNQVQILGENTPVSLSECENFRKRLHNPPIQDGDTDWAITLCEISDTDEIDIDQDNTNTNSEPSGEAIRLPQTQEGDQQ